MSRISATAGTCAAYGIVSSDVRHVFARVYEGAATPDTSPPAGIDTGWASTIGSTSWKIDLLPLPAGTNLATSKKIATWHDNGSDLKQGAIHTFTATASTRTFCEIYGGITETAKAAKPVAKDWSTLPDRWQFHLAGVSNASSPNCGCLNGSWLLKRDGETLWTRKIDTSFADPKRPCWWRLSFNPKDGFWYLECVGDPEQPVGVSIAYRRHESAFAPCGANEMALLTCHGYCHVPDFVTLSPA